MANTRVQIEFIEEPIQVRVDISKLTWGDLLELQRRGAGDLSEAEAMETTNKLLAKVLDQDPSGMPAMVVAAVLQEIMERAGALMSAKN